MFSFCILMTLILINSSTLFPDYCTGYNPMEEPLPSPPLPDSTALSTESTIRQTDSFVIGQPSQFKRALAGFIVICQLLFAPVGNVFHFRFLSTWLRLSSSLDFNASWRLKTRILAAYKERKEMRSEQDIFLLPPDVSHIAGGTLRRRSRPAWGSIC